MRSTTSNWIPLTWLSLMLDYDDLRLSRRRGHPFTNVLLHAANAVLVFAFFAGRRETSCDPRAWRPLCPASAARRIGRLDHRAQRRLKRAFLV